MTFHLCLRLSGHEANSRLLEASRHEAVTLGIAYKKKHYVNNLREKILARTRVRILVQARIFSLKLLIYDLPDGYSES